MSDRIRNALAGWVVLVTGRPALVVAAALAVATLASIYTVRSLSIDTSTTEMISAEVPFRQHDIAFKRAFPEFGDTIVAVIDATTPEQADRAARALAQALEADTAHFAAVDAPGGDPFFARHGLLYLSVNQLAGFADRLATAQPLLAALADDPNLRGLVRFIDLAHGQMALDEPPPEDLEPLFAAMADVVDAQLTERPAQLSWRSLIAGAGVDASTRRIVIAQPVLDRGSLAPAADAIRALRAEAVAQEIDPAHGLRLRLTGEAALEQDELESVTSSALLASMLTTAGVTVLLIWGLQSLRLIAATLITLAVGLIATAGLATLTVGELNLISVTFAVLFVGLGVDFGIHFGLRYQEAIDRGSGSVDALGVAAASVGGALTLSALCAAFGFLAFAPTSYQGLAELGWISATGMVVAWLTTLTLMPALLRLMPIVPKRSRQGHGPVVSSRFARPVLMLSALAGLTSCAALPFIRFDFNPLNLMDPRSESLATFYDLADSPLTSPYGIDVLASDLDQAATLAGQLEDLDAVGETVTLQSFVPDRQDEKLEIIDQLTFYLGPTLVGDAAGEPVPTPELRDAFAALGSTLGELAMAGPESEAARFHQALQAFEVEFGTAERPLVELDRRLMGLLPDLLDQLGLALEAQPVTLAELPGDLRALWLNADGMARILVRPAAPLTSNTELGLFAREVLAAVPTATGTPVIVTEAGDVVIQAFLEASVLALVLITALLALVLRTPHDILLVLLPLGLAILLTAATTVLLDLEFNFANVIVLPLLLGLGVSGAIHVVLRRRRQGDDAALFATSTPRAVVFSGLTTIASFGSLAVSTHRGMESMGQLLTIAILWSLFCTLVFLPSLLSVMRPASPQKGK